MTGFGAWATILEIFSESALERLDSTPLLQADSSCVEGEIYASYSSVHPKTDKGDIATAFDVFAAWTLVTPFL